MLKISVVEGPRQRRLIVEGKLIANWAVDLYLDLPRVENGIGTTDISTRP